MSKLLARDGKIITKDGEGFILPGADTEDISGSQQNEYVAAYVADALTAYAADPTRTRTVVVNYNSPVAGVRKDEPLPLTAETGAGKLIVHDNLADSAESKSVSAGNQLIYNVALAGGQYLLDNNGIEKTGRLLPTGAVRMIYAPSVSNVRDIGGWTCDGGTIKYGKIYRGGDLDELTDADKKMFADFLRVGTEIDFTDSEGESSFGARVKYVTCPTSKLYREMIEFEGTDYTAAKNALLAVFDSVGNNIPAYFHCAQGADRTGTLALMIEALLGVPEHQIDIDYELTSFSAAGNRLRFSNSSPQTPRYLDLIRYLKTCTTSTSLRDGVVAWCALAGIDIAKLNAFRAAMSTGTPETVSAQINYSTLDITLSASTLTIQTGAQAVLTAIKTPSWATDAVTWQSSNTGVATVSGGIVQGVAPGTCTITATSNGHSATCSVTVSGPTPTYHNLVPESTNADGTTYNTIGYKNGYRLNSSATETAQSGSVCTGFMPFTLGDTIRIAGALWNKEDTSIATAIFAYDSSHVLIGAQKGALLNGQAKITKDGSVYTYHIGDQAEIISGSGSYTIINSSRVAYIRISAAGSGVNLIVTKNEPIS